MGVASIVRQGSESAQALGGGVHIPSGLIVILSCLSFLSRTKRPQNLINCLAGPLEQGATQVPR